MKELSEYKVEIFRRSEEKKRQIRRRRQVALAVGVPFCLCCVVTAVMLPILLGGKKSALSTDAVFDAPASQEYSMQTIIFRVTGPEDVSAVLQILEETASEDSLNRENDLLDQEIPAQYQLILCHPDGSRFFYWICGEYADCKTTGEVRSLTPEQAHRLYTMLVQTGGDS